MSPLRRRAALTVATLLASAVGAATPQLVSTSSTAERRSTAEVRAASPQPADPEITAARTTLDTVRDLFTEPSPTSYARRAVASAGAHEATLALRDLRIALPELSGADATTAQQVLSRPTDPSTETDGGFHYNRPSEVDCTYDLCVHWVERGRDAVAPQDTDGDGVPDWVETTQQTLETAWKHYARTGYRAPLSDEGRSSHGPNDKIDVYLADVASLGFYGYCPPDGLERGERTSSGFCVLDNDYAYEQVSTEPTVALRAAVAHELFHLVQFAYDAREDLWLMEGTSTWMEDEVFDTVNDNWNYLGTSTLAHPGIPIDYGQDYFPFGAWTWWRFLSEYFGTAKQPAPQVIREIWEAAGDPGKPRDSLTATRFVLGQLDVGFQRAFSDYSALSHVSRRWYFEGADAPYPQAPMARRLTLSRARPGTGALRTVTLDHLTSANVAFDRSTTLTGARELRIWVNGPSRVSSPVAEVTLHKKDGSLAWRTMKLDELGNGVITVPFSRATISRVVLTLVNASTRMVCDKDTTLACGGLPRDDGRSFSYRARAIS